MFLNSFKNIYSKRFAKSFVFETLAVIAFILIFSYFAVKIQHLAPKLKDIAPLAQQTIDTLQNSKTEITDSNVALIKENASLIKTLAYSFFFSAAKYLFAAFLSLSFFVYGLKFISWSALTDRKFNIRMLGKFYLLRMLWAVVWLFIMISTALIFEFYTNVIIIFIELILYFNFGILLNFVFFTHGARLKYLFRCFILGSRPEAGIWLALIILVFLSAIFISKLLILFNFYFVLFAILIILLFFPWSKIYLLQIYNEKKMMK